MLNAADQVMFVGARLEGPLADLRHTDPPRSTIGHVIDEFSPGVYTVSFGLYGEAEFLPEELRVL